MRLRNCTQIGGLLATAAFAVALLFSALFAREVRADFNDYGIASFNASLSTSQAGAHPDFTTKVEFKADPASATDPTGLKQPYADTREITVNIPPGLIGNLNAVPTCSALQLAEIPFNGIGCPMDSQVGILVVRLYGLAGAFTSPIYLMESPSNGSVAQLGVRVYTVTSIIDVNIRSNEDYGVSASVKGIPTELGLVSAQTTLWGVPADPSHDRQRLTFAEYSQLKSESPPRPSGLVPEPFMTNPTSCSGPLNVTVSAISYQLPEDQPTKEVTELPEITGCGVLEFEPSFSALSTNRATAAPSGLDVDLKARQNEAVNGLATSALRDARVVLPPGMTIAPGAADGLEGCSAMDVGYKLLPIQDAHCPDASKIASAEFDVPALSRTMKGAVYQRSPEPGHLFHIWLVADELGVHLKMPGEIEADPKTGQLSSLFVDNPQVPLHELKLHFKGGPRGVLATPSKCGTNQTHYEFTPWSGNAPAVGDTPMQIDEGCDTGGFAPRLSAGTVNPVAGSFSPVVTTLTQESGEANLSGLEVGVPPGVLAKIAGVPLCPDAQAATGDCPAGSQVGTTTVATGPGPAPLWIPQPGKSPTAVYLAGPYEGGPYSLVVKTPAQAGPFDLGNVIVRASIEVDPETTKVTVKSDPLPQILEGVPISYRTVHVKVDRPEFTLNPTSCEPMAVTGNATSIDGQSASLSDRFQVGSCERLRFKPKLSMRLTGPTHRGAFPSFHAVLKMPKGGANIARASVRLPRSEFVENAHFRNICTRVQFAAEECPAKSVYGHVVATTPLLDQPLSGPVYLRSSNNKLPDLVADLRGQIHVVLDGRIDSVNGGLRAVFQTVPDAPVSQFKIDMQGRSKGLLVNSENLCKGAHRSVVKFTAQNGRVWNARIPLKANCGK
jgi:hypothetical protein